MYTPTTLLLLLCLFLTATCAHDAAAKRGTNDTYAERKKDCEKALEYGSVTMDYSVVPAYCEKDNYGLAVAAGAGVGRAAVGRGVLWGGVVAAVGVGWVL